MQHFKLLQQDPIYIVFCTIMLDLQIVLIYRVGHYYTDSFASMIIDYKLVVVLGHLGPHTVYAEPIVKLPKNR